MGVNSATCDYENCKAEARHVDYNHSWWCDLHWWQHANGNEESIHCLKRDLKEATRIQSEHQKKVTALEKRLKATKKIVKKLEVG